MSDRLCPLCREPIAGYTEAEDWKLCDACVFETDETRCTKCHHRKNAHVSAGRFARMTGAFLSTENFCGNCATCMGMSEVRGNND